VRAAVLLALGMLMPTVALAQEAPESAAEFAARIAEIRSSAPEIVGDETLRALPDAAQRGLEANPGLAEQVNESAGAVYQQGIELAKELAGPQYIAAEQNGSMGSSGLVDQATLEQQKADAELRFRIFITQAMSRDEVKALMEAYRGRTDVALVLRGMLPDQGLTQLQQWVANLLKPVEEGLPLPNVIIDPEPFNNLGVDHAPVMAQYDSAGKLIAYVLGMTSVDWLNDQVEAGARGNIGSYGSTVAVAEQDIIEVMQRRAERYDWAAAGDRALGRFWARTEHHELPRVTSPRQRTLDPTVEIGQTIQTPDGTVIARAGDRINPLEAAPFTQTLLFFDPGDAEQVRWAKAQVDVRKGMGVVAMATQLRSLDGLEALGKMSDSLGARIYALPRDVRDRFHVQRVPTLVRAEGLHFVIDEQRPSDRPEG